MCHVTDSSYIQFHDPGTNTACSGLSLVAVLLLQISPISAPGMASLQLGAPPSGRLTVSSSQLRWSTAARLSPPGSPLPSQSPCPTRTLPSPPPCVPLSMRHSHCRGKPSQSVQKLFTGFYMERVPSKFP